MIYNLFCLGSKKEIKRIIEAENTKEAYLKFISFYKKDLKEVLNYNKNALICWTKKNNLFIENGQKDLIKFKKEVLK